MINLSSYSILLSKHLHGAAAAFVAVKKARLKVAVSMSRGSTALIATPPPASLAAAAEVAVPCSGISSLLPAGVSVSSSSPAPPAAVATPPPPTNTVISPPMARPSPAQNAAGLGPQSPAVPSSSLCEKAPVQPLASTATCLHCIKQLKKKGILFQMLKQYRARVSELQVLMNSIKAGEISLAHL
ncbi:uncharacterized protein BDCG_17524 [Blastomyces dermatitidis ER-3]|uniref:Uncharacterized protein n=1 Tax=Ajellomyces dermatitidis (strain ER-3 / ATCC MYA-2586) TaxID=559297 RepID=A0ABX2VZ33_AJEDR|nr:uncharacterized protein BDCG_17524 [Blastomyces dermatitidis ER-3]OAT02397.1 hypothetical protein BDCG_17524 [Blastomyces dermatitidis ER-3]